MKLNEQTAVPQVSLITDWGGFSFGIIVYRAIVSLKKILPYSGL